MTAKRIDIVYKRDHWIAEGSKHREVATADSKDALVGRVARDARRNKKAVTVRIHKKNGHLQEERAYPSKVKARASKR
jgi:hypothetical protein